MAAHVDAIAIDTDITITTEEEEEDDESDSSGPGSYMEVEEEGFGDKDHFINSEFKTIRTEHFDDEEAFFGSLVSNKDLARSANTEARWKKRTNYMVARIQYDWKDRHPTEVGESEISHRTIMSTRASPNTIS